LRLTLFLSWESSIPSLLGEFSRVALELHYFLGCTPPLLHNPKTRETPGCPATHTLQRAHKRTRFNKPNQRATNQSHKSPGRALLGFWILDRFQASRTMRAAAVIASGIPRLGQSFRLQRHALQLARGAQRASIFTWSAAVGRGRTSPLWDHLGTGRRFVQVEAGEVRKVSRP